MGGCQVGDDCGRVAERAARESRSHAAKVRAAWLHNTAEESLHEEDVLLSGFRYRSITLGRWCCAIESGFRERTARIEEYQTTPKEPHDIASSLLLSWGQRKQEGPLFLFPSSYHLRTC
jgi:hypothetical protein